MAVPSLLNLKRVSSFTGPLIVNEGDVIRVDTRESKYVERVGKKK